MNARTMQTDQYYSTNASVYLAVANESCRSMRDDLQRRVLPKPDGSPGNVLVFDPDRRSYKDAFITIVFSGMYVDAMLHILLVKRRGLDVARALDHATYEKKMEELGCQNQDLLTAAARFRTSRREVVHEKAFLDQDSFKVAQDEAESSIAFVETFNQHFGIQSSAFARSTGRSGAT